MATTIELEQLRAEPAPDSSSSEGSSPNSSPRTSPKHLIKKSTIALIRKMPNFDETDVNPITLLKVHQVVILICSIILVILVLQIPTILYYVKSPSSPSSVVIPGIDIDFKTCTVSSYYNYILLQGVVY